MTVISTSVGGPGAVSSAAVRTSKTAAEATVWASFSSLSIRSACAIAGPTEVIATGGSKAAGTSTLLFSYDDASISSLVGTNSPVAGSGTLTIIGQGVGGHTRASTSIKVRVGASSSVATLWISESTLFTKLAGGFFGSHAVIASLAVHRARTATFIMSYDVQQVSGQVRRNFPLTASVSATIVGSNFANIDYSARIAMHSVTQATTWVSDSHLSVKTMLGTGSGAVLPGSGTSSLGVVASVGRRFNTLTMACSHDIVALASSVAAGFALQPPRYWSHVVDCVAHHAPRFASPAARTFGAAAAVTAWVSSSSLILKTTSSPGGNVGSANHGGSSVGTVEGHKTVVLSIAGSVKDVNTLSCALTVDAVGISALFGAAQNVAPTAAMSVTIVGSALGADTGGLYSELPSRLVRKLLDG